MKNKQLKTILSLIVTVVFSLIITWYIVDNWHDFTSISVTNPLLLVFTLFIMSINIYASGAVIDLAMEPHGVKVSRYEAFGLANITRFSNQFSPSYIGATVRATYMKRVHNVSYAKFSSSFVVNNLLQLVISGLLALATFIILGSSPGDTNALAILIGVIVLFAVILLLPVRPYIRLLERLKRKSGGSKVFERLVELLQGYATVRKYPGLLMRTIGWMFLISFTSALSLFLSYAALGVQIDFFTALFISTLSSWAIVFSVTPGGIGVKEGLMAVAAQIAGVSVASTLVVAVLLRLLMFVASGLFSLYFTPRLLGRGLGKTTNRQ